MIGRYHIERIRIVETPGEGKKKKKKVPHPSQYSLFLQSWASEASAEYINPNVSDQSLNKSQLFSVMKS